MAILILMLFVLISPSEARVYIDIDAPDFQKFPIAITDFNKLSAERSTQDLSPWFSATLATYLNMTGFFNVIPKKAFLEYPEAVPQGYEKVNFPNWTMIGADYLVRGTYRVGNQTLSAEMRLYDTVKGELVTSNRYTGRLEDKNNIAKKIAGDILLALTGEGSIFNTKIAFVKRRGPNGEIYTIGFDATGLTQITNIRSLTLAPRWSPDGTRISFTSYRDGNPDFYIRDLKSGSTKKASHHPGINLSGSWSPDGKKILLTLSFEGNQEIYAMDVAGGQLKRLTYSHDIDVSPTWSPDGHNIAFVSNHAGSPQIYIMDADGNNIRRLTYDGNYNTSPSWSSKANRIAYEGTVGGSFQIFTINADGTNAVQLTSAGGEHKYPSWSPDGRYIAFTLTTRGSQKIGIMNANGTNIRILSDGSNPAWSPVLE
ncbi:MAG: Tol-Pal system beta propeller repeat protein TolB, partial [Syntrophales bacterium]|nr:Tol-Pal system beta propeller repeat protein TolB [Syntrophales bacterium]